MRLNHTGVRYVLAFFIAVVSMATVTCPYFPESVFQLAPESRLPRWLTLPQGLSRADVTVQMAYYSYPWKTVAVFTLSDAKGNKLDEVEGKVRNSMFPSFSREPAAKVPPNAQMPPKYEVITARGISEIIEHKVMGPVFHITDDPEVKRWLDVGPM